MSVVTKSIDVDVPMRVAYNQWTQFEEFPRFMEGVESIEQFDDVRLRWHISIGGIHRTFEALIEEQEPDSRVAWRSTEGPDHAGKVSFAPLESDRTRVEVEMEYEPEGWTEKIADALNIIDRRVERDLERFKEFIENEGRETGAWRGEIDDAQVVEGDTGQPQGSASGEQPDPSSSQSRPHTPPPVPQPGTPQTGVPATGESPSAGGRRPAGTEGTEAPGQTPRPGTERTEEGTEGPGQTSRR